MSPSPRIFAAGVLANLAIGLLDKRAAYTRRLEAALRYHRRTALLNEASAALAETARAVLGSDSKNVDAQRF